MSSTWEAIKNGNIFFLIQTIRMWWNFRIREKSPNLCYIRKQVTKDTIRQVKGSALPEPPSFRNLPPRWPEDSGLSYQWLSAVPLSILLPFISPSSFWLITFSYMENCISLSFPEGSHSFWSLCVISCIAFISSSVSMPFSLRYSYPWIFWSKPQIPWYSQYAHAVAYSTVWTPVRGTLPWWTGELLPSPRRGV